MKINYLCLLPFAALALLFVLLSPARAYDGTLIGDHIRDNMAVGEFSQWTTSTNLVYDVIRDPNSEGIGTNDRNVLQFTPTCIWDAQRNEFRCNSSGHATGCNSGRHFRYDSDTNEWTFSGQTVPTPADPISRSPRNCIHAYGGNTHVESTGVSWYHDDGSPNTYLYSYVSATDTWTLERTNPFNACRGGGGESNTAFGQLIWVPTANAFFWYNSFRGASLIDTSGDAVGGCLCNTGVCASTTNTEYHGIAHYNPIADHVVFGMGNASPRIHIWPVGAPSATVDYGTSPTAVGMNQDQAISAMDTLSGLMWAYGKKNQGYPLYSYDSQANTWSANQGPHPVVNGGTGVYSSIAFVEEYGAMFIIASQGVNNTPTFWIHKTSTPAATPPEDLDFQTRCNQVDVVLCEGFDQATDVTDHRSPDGNQNQVTHNTSDYASGGGSMQFVLPGTGGSSSGGQWRLNFNGCSHPYTAGECPTVESFGAGDTFFVQVRMKLPPELDTFFYDHSPSGQAGNKFMILSNGEAPGATSEAGSCSDNHLTIENSRSAGYYNLYHACGVVAHLEDTCVGKATCPDNTFIRVHNQHYPGHPSGNEYCMYDAGQGLGPTPFTFPKDVAAAGPCKALVLDQWITMQMQVIIGASEGPGDFSPSGANSFSNGYQNSTIRLWFQDSYGQPSELTADYKDNITLRAETSEKTWEKVWLLPYVTNKAGNVAHPDVTLKYDELIVSKSCIADPGTGMAPPGCAASNPTITDFYCVPQTLPDHECTVRFTP